MLLLRRLTTCTREGGVLVAAGEMTAYVLQGLTTQIPIILAYGGEKPSNAAKNMTGFVGSCVDVGKYHLKKLKDDNQLQVTVMYDPDNSNHATQNVLNALKQFTPLPKTFADLSNQTAAELATELTTSGFMLIPNAFYYQNAELISDAVENANQVQMAYYPEVEYWRNHKKRKGIAKVYGHNVPLTYRLAASWVDNLLNGYWTIDTMPKKFADAIAENYE